MRCVTCGEPNPKSVDPCPSCGAGAAPAQAGPRTAAELEAAFAADSDEGPAGQAGPLRVGQDFGTRYTVLKLLGAGGMGVVYQALDRELNVPVALKVLRPAGANRRAVAELHHRLKTELLLARKVTHKHVIRIHDIGEIDGIRFITMPFVDGRDLASMLKKGPLPIVRAVRYARQIAAGLAAAHAAGVIHRDLKPANIMVDEHDNALLMDFGIARSSAPGTPQRTIAGAVVGTAAYMPPEQARGERVDHRADIYAFGLILHEMLCGPRFMPKGAVADLFARLTAAPAPARASNRNVPEALDAIVTRCVQPQPEDRFQTAVELATALAGLSRRGRGPVPGAAPPSRRWMLKAAAMLALLLLGGLGYWHLGRADVAATAPEPVVVREIERVAERASAPPADPAALAAAERDFEKVLEIGAAAAPVTPVTAAATARQAEQARSYLGPAAAAALTRPDAARQAYMRMAELGPQGASLAATGLADLEMLRRHHEAAAEMLQRAIEMDRRARNLAALAPKYLALAEARMEQGRLAEAATAVHNALESSRQHAVLLPAARMYVALDRDADAGALSTELRDGRGPYGAAYADIVDAELALNRGDEQRAIEMLQNLVRTSDLWLARFVLGTAYAQAERYPEAFAEFEGCQVRRAEAATLFDDYVPTLRYLAALEDWTARVRRNVAMTGR